MPRLPQFDRSSALGAATDVFWANGYEASSVQMLLDAMGINRGSLYASFGNKASLFNESIEYYSKKADQLIAETLLSITDPVSAIRQFFYSAFLNGERAVSKHGCLLFNTISELSDTYPELAASSERQIDKLRCAIKARLEEAKQRQLLADSVEVDATASLLVAIVAGLWVHYKMGVSQELLQQMIDVSLDALLV